MKQGLTSRLLLLSIFIGLTACSTTEKQSAPLTTANNAPLSQQLAQPNMNNPANPSSSSNASMPGNLPPANAAPIGGNIAGGMDSIDRSKLSHALDKPIGKSTQWTNANNGITYLVVSTQKLSINGNSFCRKYTLTATRNNNSRQTEGTACVGADSNWQVAN